MLNRLAELVLPRVSTDAQLQPVAAVSPIAWRDFTLGEQLRAQVLTVLSNGLFKVAIEEQPFVLRLPFQARAGDVMELVVTAKEPTLKFALASQEELQGAPTRLSDTARFITALLSVNERLPVAKPAVAGVPLLAEPPTSTSTPQIAAELKHALTTSGMFYESHQAQWVAGERPLADLRKEPQGALPPLRTGPENNAAVRGENRAARGNNAPEPGKSAALRGNDVNVYSREQLDSPGGELGKQSVLESPVHRDALAIVRQQLDALDTRNVLWTGLIWNGQPLDWEIGEQPHDPQSPPEMQEWRTSLHLTLPHLGEVTATLLVAKRGVGIALNAADDGAAALLSANRMQLTESMRKSGITTTSFTVDKNGKT
jgi:hypothetical protein